jgi:hypothetical protein
MLRALTRKIVSPLNPPRFTDDIVDIKTTKISLTDWLSWISSHGMKSPLRYLLATTNTCWPPGNDFAHSSGWLFQVPLSVEKFVVNDNPVFAIWKQQVGVHSYYHFVSKNLWILPVQNAIYFTHRISRGLNY